MRSMTVLLLTLLATSPIMADDGWVELTPPGHELAAWKSPHADWKTADSVGLRADNPRLLSFEPGEGILVNGPTGRTRNIVTEEEFGDVALHAEFLVPKGSNSGIKFNGQYEIQIADSFGKAEPTARDCGGIYPRAELLPKYRYVDQGFPPRVNACKAPGEWQTLDIVFRAPRFDAEGKKTANARFDKVVLNGQVVHEDVEVPYPTGHAWHNKEVARGPILLQADHGPVAFRNLKVRRLGDSDSR